MLAEPTEPRIAVPGRAGLPRLATCAVWGAWAVLFAALLGFVAHFSRNVPFSDDWDVLPWVGGERPVDASWLWAPYHEHRIALPKLLWVVLARLTRCDVRAGMVLNCLILGGLSAAAIVTARRLRGRTALADAFFPLALLHWGQHQNLLWDFGVQFVCSTLFAVGLLLALVSVRDIPTPRQGIVAGLCLLGLPLCGANGLLLVPLPAAWLGATSLARRPMAGRAPGLVLAGAALLLAALSLIGETGVGSHPASPGMTETVQTACQFLVMSVGPGGEIGLPISALVLVLLLAGCAGAVAASLRRREDFWRASGMLCYLAAFLGLALAVGWGRAGSGGVTAAYGTRFVTLAVPLFCWCYFAALLVPARRGPLRLVPPGLCVLMLLLLPFNARQGMRHGEENAAILGAAQADIRIGTPPEELAPRWCTQVYPPGGRTEYLRDRLEWLRRTGQGPYKGLESSDPAVRDGAGPAVK
jgi:hypothetical protein